MPTAFQILDEFGTPDDKPIQDAKGKIAEFVAEIEKRHEPLTGEAYPDDRNRYCAVCRGSNGEGSARFPCGTIRLIRKLLK